MKIVIGLINIAVFIIAYKYKYKWCALSVSTIEPTHGLEPWTPRLKGEISVSEELTVLENEGYVQETNTIYYIAGYTKMKVGNQYLLLLRAADGNPWFIPVGVNIGKVPLDKKERILAAQCNEQEIIAETEKMNKKIKEKYVEKK